MTHEVLHVRVCDHSLKFQVPSSYGLGVKVFEDFEEKDH